MPGCLGPIWAEEAAAGGGAGRVCACLCLCLSLCLCVEGVCDVIVMGMGWGEWHRMEMYRDRSGHALAWASCLPWWIETYGRAGALDERLQCVLTRLVGGCLFPGRWVLT